VRVVLWFKRKGRGRERERERERGRAGEKRGRRLFVFGEKSCVTFFCRAGIELAASGSIVRMILIERRFPPNVLFERSIRLDRSWYFETF